MITERTALRGLALHFRYFQNRCVPNVFIGAGEMDLAVLSRSGYLTEVEVKLTRDDWNRDRVKRKWELNSNIVSRFFHAAPPALLDKCPAWVPETAGLIALVEGKDDGRVLCIRQKEAAKSAAPKLEQRYIHALNESTYYCFWRRELAA